MRFQSVLAEFRSQFRPQGVFPLRKDQLIRAVVKANRVPSKPGTYVVSAIGSDATVIYVGMAGTLQNDGTWSGQALSGRLCAKQNRVLRCEAFQNWIRETGADELSFEWFVTAGKRVILPVLAESMLLQAYYEDHQRLPRYNLCA